MPFAHPNEQLSLLLRGVLELVEREELLAKLTRSAETGRPLRVLAGFDPTGPDLHLGHAVLLRKLSQFQQLGHEVIFLIGDYTARIGDPTGRREARPRLGAEEIEANARRYREQIGRILDPGRTRLEANSRWLSGLTLNDLLRLARHLSLDRLLARDDLPPQSDLHLDALLYSVLQAYDSIHLKVDIEVGGRDQLPNLLLTRDLMAELGMEPQCVMVTDLLEGTDSRLEEGRLVGNKMGKSLDNAIGIADPPETIRARLARMDEGLLWRCFELLTDFSLPQIRAFQADREAGKRTLDSIREILAGEIIRLLGEE